MAEMAWAEEGKAMVEELGAEKVAAVAVLETGMAARAGAVE